MKKNKKYKLNKKTFTLFIVKVLAILFFAWLAFSYIDIITKNLNVETTYLWKWNIVKLLFSN